MSGYEAPRGECWCWAKLVHPENMPPQEDWASIDWEVVHVFDNNGEGDDAFRVSVTGISPSQPLSAFIWGPQLKTFSEVVHI